MKKDRQRAELYHKKSDSHARFLTWVSANIGGPIQALERYLPDAVAAAASVEALLDSLPILDGQRHYLPSLDGRRDQRQFYIGDYRTDSDGTIWPSVTFGTYRHGGSTAYWCPRDLAWQEYRANPDALTDRLDQYRARAEAARADAQAKAAESAQQVELGRIEAQRAAQAAWAAGLPAESHPYLTRKGITVAGLRIAGADLRRRLFADGEWRERIAVRTGDLLVPMYDPDGELANIERITGTGKLGLAGGRRDGCHFRIQGGPRVVLAEGLATAAAWHQATGDTVVVCFGATNLPKVAAYLQADFVAADHDASGAGEKAARATGLPFLMPPTVGHDWDDHIRRHGPGELLAALNDVPVFDNCPGKDARIELKKGKVSTWWNKYRATQTPADAAAWCWSLGLKRVSRIPVQQSLDELMDELRLHAPAGLIRSETFAAVRACLSRMIEWRRNRALSSVSLSKAITRRHRHEVHETLPNLLPGEYRGVILLKAPMGSGKTQLVGNPFSLWAKTQPGVFLAICHRRSLVRELSIRLRTDHYTEVDGEMAFGIKALSTCLPSLVKDEHQQIMEGARFVFIDEISQVLRLFDANVTVASGKTKPELFTALREIVRQAECLIGADAGLDDRTVRFLESCRPGERFRIVDVAHEDQGRKVQFGFGQDALASAYGEALTRLASGERIWIGCEERAKAVEVARVLSTSGKRILLLHSQNNGHNESVAFYADCEGESRKYDCVIHTSVISSGISIEHRGRPHFDHGMFIGTGNKIPPSDALQMMCRVRYLKTWTVVATPNNVSAIADENAILEAVTDAAKLEGTPGDCTDLDRLIAGIRADVDKAKADFAAGLWWLLEHQRFSVEPLSAPAACGLDLDQVRDELKAEHVRRILDADLVGEDEYYRLSRASEQTEETRYQVLKYGIRIAMGMRELDEDVIAAWDNGRGPARMDRFSAVTLGLAGLDDQGPDLTLRRFHKARTLAYQMLLDGIELGPNFRITQEVATTIVERAIRHRFMMSYLGVVPTKYAAFPEKPFPMPAYPLREVGEILRGMGLKTARRRKNLKARMGARCPGSTLDKTRESGTQRAILDVETWYEIDANSWHKMAWWVERRNKYRRTEEVAPNPDWQAMAFGVRSGIEPSVSAAITHIPEPELSGRHDDGRTQSAVRPDMPVSLGDPIDRSSIRTGEPPDGLPRPAWSKPSAVIRKFLPDPTDDPDFGVDEDGVLDHWSEWSSMSIEPAYG